MQMGTVQRRYLLRRLQNILCFTIRYCRCSYLVFYLSNICSFSQHHTFMFYIYDLILIRQASFGNYVQVKNGYWAKATEELARLSADDLQRAAEEFNDRKKISNPAIHSLITNMRIISSFNPE